MCIPSILLCPCTWELPQPRCPAAVQSQPVTVYTLSFTLGGPVAHLYNTGVFQTLSRVASNKGPLCLRDSPHDLTCGLLLRRCSNIMQVHLKPGQTAPALLVIEPGLCEQSLPISSFANYVSACRLIPILLYQKDSKAKPLLALNWKKVMKHRLLVNNRLRKLVCMLFVCSFVRLGWYLLKIRD